MGGFYRELNDGFKNSHQTFFLYLVFCSSAHCAAQPNIVFIFADDQSWPHASAYGDDSVKTPSFDKIAENGVLFNNAYTSAPSCSPSRAAVLSGRNHWELESAANLQSAYIFQMFPDSLSRQDYCKR